MDYDWKKKNNPPHCVFCDSNEHYTVDHPKDNPAAILTDADPEVTELISVTLSYDEWVQVSNALYAEGLCPKAVDAIAQALFESEMDPLDDEDLAVDVGDDDV